MKEGTDGLTPQAPAARIEQLRALLERAMDWAPASTHLYAEIFGAIQKQEQLDPQMERYQALLRHINETGGME
jgi:hypothetical protein